MSGAKNERAARRAGKGGEMSNTVEHTTRGGEAARPIPPEWERAISDCARLVTSFDRYVELVRRVRAGGMSLEDLRAYTQELRGAR